ncbi:MFS general substrate transporter [Ophiobolus disseminans]|uniref:MFS general substrate transporter n=1 Tax=Ophiobolus disseminans TaxID=1469910 RepID=A0A6A6ZS49_9PLEO|nr:MFS general substrate transporter [Ophiobolus disseminans]
MHELHNSNTQDAAIEVAPPDGGYGWVCVAACFTINCHTWGAVSSYGIYLSHYLADNNFPEASAWDYAFVGGFNFAIAMLVAPVVTTLTRKFGIHIIMSIGLVLQFGGFITASFATRIWQLHLTQGVIIGCGIGFLYIPALPILSQWFVRRRSLANGISAAGSGVGGAAFTWGTEAIIQRWNIQWALRITGLIALVANFVAIVVIRDRNKAIQPTQLGFDTKLLRRYEVLLLLAWAFISMLGYVVLLFSLTDFALSIGLSRTQATDIIGLLNVGTAIGRPIIGVVSDRWSRIDTAGVLTLLCGLSCFAFWLPATSYGLTVFFAMLCGAIVGVFWMTIGPLCIEVAGLKDLQSLLSLSWASVIVPAIVSEGIALKLRRSTSSGRYLYVQIFAGLAYIVASGFMFQLRRVKNRQSRNPGNDTPAATRIRENQRRSRNRRKELVEDLQKRIQEFEEKGVTATVEMQRAARRVAHENAGLRSLLMRHGVTEGEMSEYLRTYGNFQGSNNTPMHVATIPKRLHDPSPRELSFPNVEAGQACCRNQVVECQKFDENTIQHLTPDLPPANPIRQADHLYNHRETNVQVDEPCPDVAICHGDADENLQIIATAHPEEPECPNTADCFCPPITTTDFRPSRHDLEISCEAAATIIVEMRGDGDIDSARAALGCIGGEVCNIKNSTVLQIMDEG